MRDRARKNAWSIETGSRYLARSASASSCDRAWAVAKATVARPRGPSVHASAQAEHGIEHVADGSRKRVLAAKRGRRRDFGSAAHEPGAIGFVLHLAEIRSREHVHGELAGAPFPGAAFGDQRARPWRLRPNETGC